MLFDSYVALDTSLRPEKLCLAALSEVLAETATPTKIYSLHLAYYLCQYQNFSVSLIIKWHLVFIFRFVVLSFFGR